MNFDGTFRKLKIDLNTYHFTNYIINGTSIINRYPKKSSEYRTIATDHRYDFNIYSHCLSHKELELIVDKYYIEGDSKIKIGLRGRELLSPHGHDYFSGGLCYSSFSMPTFLTCGFQILSPIQAGALSGLSIWILSPVNM